MKPGGFGKVSYKILPISTQPTQHSINSQKKLGEEAQIGMK